MGLFFIVQVSVEFTIKQITILSRDNKVPNTNIKAKIKTLTIFMRGSIFKYHTAGASYSSLSSVSFYE